MTATLDTARDEIHEVFQAAWDAGAGAYNGGTVPPVAYEGRAFTTPQAAPWARIRVRHVTGGQATLSGGLGGGSRPRFRKTGTVIVSIFQPVEAGGDTLQAENLAKVAKAAFEGKATPSQVWFRDVVPNEVGIDGPWFQVNVIASFDYDEFVT